MKKKRMNSYVKIVFWLVFFTGLGAVFGALSAHGDREVRDIFQEIFLMIRERGPWLQVWILLGSGAIWILSSWKIRRYGVELLKEEDEGREDEMEFRLDFWSNFGVVGSNMGLLLSILNLSITVDNAESLVLEGWKFGILLGCFFGECVLASFWQIFLVKQLQKIYPEKKGDPSNLRFQREWLESCDEAEREIIYQASYRTYQMVNALMPLAAILATVCHFVWKTGLFAVVLSCVLWAASVLVYSVNSAKLQRKKLNID